MTRGPWAQCLELPSRRQLFPESALNLIRGRVLSHAQLNVRGVAREAQAFARAWSEDVLLDVIQSCGTRPASKSCQSECMQWTPTADINKRSVTIRPFTGYGLRVVIETFELGAPAALRVESISVHWVLFGPAPHLSHLT